MPYILTNLRLQIRSCALCSGNDHIRDTITKLRCAAWVTFAHATHKHSTLTLTVPTAESTQLILVAMTGTETHTKTR